MSAKYLLLFAVTIAISSAQRLDNGDIQAETVQDVIKISCYQSGKPEAFPLVEKAYNEMESCMVRIIVTLFGLPPDFKKYCAMKPEFETYAKNFLAIVATCITEKEQEIINNMFQELEEFIWSSEGLERITRFIMDGGAECLEGNEQKLDNCLQTLDDTLEKQGVNINTLSDYALMFNEKNCKQFYELQKCVVAVFETCPNPSTAEITASLFKSIRQSTPCKAFKDGAATFYVTAATLVTALFATMLV